MASFLTVLVVCLLTVSAKGFRDLDSALEALEQLDREVEEHTTGLKLLIADGKHKIEELHALELQKAVARNEQTVQDTLKEAEIRKCPPQLKQEIASVGANVDDRWQSCMNMTSKLVDFENVTLTLYKDFLSWRPTVCDAANNLTMCFQVGGIIDKASCAFDGMMGYLDSFSAMKDQVIDVVKAVNRLVLETIEDMKACFGTAQSADSVMIRAMLEQGCPPKRGKPLSL